MSELEQIQGLLNNKQFDPDKLTRDQENQMNMLFRSGQLKGYDNVSDIKQERSQARRELAAEAETADRPIETATQDLPVFGEVNRQTFEGVGDITGSLIPYFQDREKLKQSFIDMGYKNRFGINYPDKFLDKVGDLQDAASKVTVGKKRLLAQAAKISPPGRVFGFLTGFLNKAKNAGKKLLTQARAVEEYGITQPLATEAKSIGMGALGAGLGSAAYDITDFGAEFASNAQLDLANISDNEIDQMSMPNRLLTKSIDAATTSLMWGAGTAALTGVIGRNLRQFGRALTGTSGADSQALAREAVRKGLPISLAAIADERKTFGGLTKGFGRVFGVIPLVNAKIQRNMAQFNEDVINYYGDYLATLGPMGYSDLLGREFLDTVRTNHKNYMEILDNTYENLEKVIAPIQDVAIVPTTHLKKYAVDLKEKILKTMPGREKLFEQAMVDPSLSKLTGLDNQMVRLALKLDNMDDFMTLGEYQGFQRMINRGLKQGGNDRLTLVARDLQNFANVDLASVSGKNIKQIKASPQYQAELAKRSGAEKIAFEKNTEELVGKFNTRLKEANEFYSRVISPYNEGMLAKLGQKADSNLFTALGELGIAGKSSIDPSDLFRKIGNITFQSGSDRSIRELKALVGYNDASGKGKKLFNAMRSRFIYNAYLNSFVDPRTDAGAELARKMAGATTDSAMDALQYVKFSRPMSPAAERALKRSEVQTDYRFADEAAGFRKGEVQTRDPRAEFDEIELNSLGDFDFEKFKVALGLGSRDTTTRRKLVEIFGDGDAKQGLKHVDDMEKLLDVLRANYGTKLSDTSTFLQRRAGLTGLSGLLAGGGVGLAAGGVGGSFIGMALATYFLRRFGHFISDPKAMQDLLQIYTKEQRKDMLVKTIKEDDGTIKEVARFGLFEPIGKGLGPRKRQSLQRVINYLNDEEEDFPGTNLDKITNEDIAKHLLKVENKPVKIPDESFKETELPQKEKAHLYPETYRMEQMDLKDKEMYRSYLEGNQQAIRNYEDVVIREIDNARQTQQVAPQLQQQNVVPMMPAAPQQTGQINTPSYEQLFPNDALGIGIQNRQR